MGSCKQWFFNLAYPVISHFKVLVPGQGDKRQGSDTLLPCPSSPQRRSLSLQKAMGMSSGTHFPRGKFMHWAGFGKFQPSIEETETVIQ
jgi:hypothetical protein